MAAGSSTRMGRPKQLLALGGSSMLERIVRVVEGSTLDPIAVVIGASADDIREKVRLARSQFVENPNYERGSVTSLLAGVAALPDGLPGVVVVAGDQPQQTSDTLDVVTDAFLVDQPWAAVPEYTSGVGHPWALSNACLSAITEAEGDKVLWQMLSTDPRVLRVPIDSPRPADVNSWEDYLAVCEALGLDPEPRERT